MKKLKKFLLWFLLLNKRLLLRGDFWVVLCIVPLLTVGFVHWVDDNEHSVLKIAVVQEGEDPVAAHIAEGLKASSVFQYVPASTALKAQELVETGAVDQAWILPEDLQHRIREELRSPFGIGESVIDIVQREDDVFLQMAKMELYGLLYPDLSYMIFENYMKYNLEDAAAAALSEEELRDKYQELRYPDKLFRFSYVDASEEATKPLDYLLSSLRPFLALWLMLCGFVAALYWKKDLAKGTFDWVSMRRRVLLGYGYQGIIVFDFALAFLCAILCSGLSLGLDKEVMLLVLLVVQIVLLCNLLSRLCGNSTAYGTLAGLLMLLLLAIFPFFLRITAVDFLQWGFPLYYYFSALHNPGFWANSLAYTGVLLLLNAGAGLVNRGRA